MRFLTSTLAAAVLMTISTAKAVEINGQSSFVAVPTKAKLTNYRWHAFECCAVYYVTLKIILHFKVLQDISLNLVNLI